MTTAPRFTSDISHFTISKRFGGMIVFVSRLLSCGSGIAMSVLLLVRGGINDYVSVYSEWLFAKAIRCFESYVGDNVVMVGQLCYEGNGLNDNYIMDINVNSKNWRYEGF